MNIHCSLKDNNYYLFLCRKYVDYRNLMEGCLGEINIAHWQNYLSPFECQSKIVENWTEYNIYNIATL